ncbi:hypothetical protein AVL56_02590 [Alteromonas stellipolaris]|uniref:hypothetical protein n=1 Tax=Alteromonas stellipolaris TaxID=233316 RepID=UPI0007706966|nr:hypothetical protein [Alteromonas stellipolaris]AMJ93298.1 hypothetical protein AVL56_02590 [Alteromonas stellipolaris]MDO6536933.1 tetratricopeptide repeat protein [Alteromonas stellipolaris]MDO6628282.1 tetratricopeptide repeat protein [Alteromonas stellipolaris]
MEFKPPFHEQVLELASTITNESSTKVYWEAHNKLRGICETHENTVLDHPFQWETLADFTRDSEERLSAYLKALKLAQQNSQVEYIASVALEISELYLAQNDNERALTYSTIAKDAALQIDDADLQMEIEEIEKRLF